MMNTAIDWNEVWKKERSRRYRPKRDVDFWNARADRFARDLSESTYSRDFLRIVEPRRCWSVLDIACGAGVIAVPLSRYVRRVTAVDFAPRMLEALEARCRAEAIENITAVNASWDDDWRSKGIKEHDVAVASRSLVADDLRSAIMKLNAVARERVYISTIVGDGPHDRRLYEALGRRLEAGPDYICNYNLLYQMGIFASIAFITEHRQDVFSDYDDARDRLGLELKRLSAVEKDRLRRYLDAHLVPRNGKVSMDYKRTILWAVMWWQTR